MCDEFLKGRNCNYIVYGPTSTGKTHTMQGPIMEDGGAKINVKSIIKKAMEL
jgi:DNA replication protein DnaC